VEALLAFTVPETTTESEAMEVATPVVTTGRPPSVVNDVMAPDTVPARFVALARK
jgi:hypothetical protein